MRQIDASRAPSADPVSAPGQAGKLALLVTQVPWARVLAAITLVLSIAQLPALVVILPAIGYIWSTGHYGHGAGIAYSIILLLSGMADKS